MAPAPGVGAMSNPRRLDVLPPLARPEPFDPLRKGLYTGDELMQGYTPSNPEASLDRRIARHFMAAGGRNPPSAAEAIAQRLHDFGIDRALTAWLEGDGRAAPKVVGVMGSHSTPRDDPQYALVADLGWRLARAGFLVATGGGPGLMEAANLGAYLSNHAESDALDRAIAILKEAPAYDASDPARYIEATRRVLAAESNGAPSLGSLGLRPPRQDSALGCDACGIDIPADHDCLACARWQFMQKILPPNRLEFDRQKAITAGDTAVRHDSQMPPEPVLIFGATEEARGVLTPPRPHLFNLPAMVAFRGRPKQTVQFNAAWNVQA